VAEPVRVDQLAASVQAVAGVVPRVSLTFDDGRVETQALGQGAPGSRGRAYTFIVMRAVPSVLVTLQVVKEPGQGLVIAGLILLTIGAFASLYLSHRTIWLILKPAGDGKTEVIFGARASRNRDGLAREFDSIRRTLDELA
jgi:cytochrome c biogenesis protein